MAEAEQMCAPRLRVSATPGRRRLPQVRAHRRPTIHARDVFIAAIVAITRTGDDAMPINSRMRNQSLATP